MSAKIFIAEIFVIISKSSPALGWGGNCKERKEPLCRGELLGVALTQRRGLGS